jgi:hypothetical protein
LAAPTIRPTYAIKNVSARVTKVLTAGLPAGCRLIKNPIRKAPTIPIIEPTAAPMRVFKDARLILRSKMIMQTAMTAPAAAEIHALEIPARSLLIGSRTYPEAMRIPAKTKRIITTSACIMGGILTRPNLLVTKNHLSTEISSQDRHS